jgi:hypothetical protein
MEESNIPKAQKYTTGSEQCEGHTDFSITGVLCIMSMHQ